MPFDYGLRLDNRQRIANAGEKPIRQTKIKRSMALKVCLLGAVRRRTLICCRNIQSSTWSAARDRNRSATIQTMSLTRSLITQQHRPILDQLLVRLSLRQGQWCQCLVGSENPDRSLALAVRQPPWPAARTDPLPVPGPRSSSLTRSATCRSFKGTTT